MPKSPIVGSFARTRSPLAADNRSVNLVLEAVETSDGKVPGYLFLASGLDLIGTLGNGPIRGVLPLKDLLYVVSGPQVFSLTPNGIATLLGPVGDQKSPVSMFRNNRQLMMVDGVGAWLVPGGLPFTSGTISDGGGLYQIGDTITLKASTGNQTSYPIIRVTAVDSPSGIGAVTAYVVTQGGAIDAPSNALTQKSTSGAGSNFTLTSPTFGSYVGLVPVTVPFPNPLVGAVSDGFGLLVFQGLQNIAQSDELDLSTWDPLNFGVADQSPDNCISIHVVHNEAYVFKENNTEVWVDEGNANFAFGPLISVHMENGIIAPFSVAVADEEVIWLSRNDQGQGIVLSANGYQTRPISTQALVNEFLSYPNLGDAIAYARQEGEHIYYVLTFPEANHTWVYDKTSSGLLRSPQWHELAAFDDGALNRHWGNAFTPWTGSVKIIQTPETFQAEAVEITTAILQTVVGLVGLSTSFSAALFSVWLFIPDGPGSGIIFGNQGASATPGLQITIENDATGTPQITVEAWDAAASPIVVATYGFANWADWVNVLISIDTATQQLQVFANTVASSALVESELTPASITWSSSNPIAPAAIQPWLLESVP
jgi:hypothetical protein